MTTVPLLNLIFVCSKNVVLPESSNPRIKMQYSSFRKKCLYAPDNKVYISEFKKYLIKIWKVFDRSRLSDLFLEFREFPRNLRPQNKEV